MPNTLPIGCNTVLSVGRKAFNLGRGQLSEEPVGGTGAGPGFSWTAEGGEQDQLCLLGGEGILLLQTRRVQEGEVHGS